MKGDNPYDILDTFNMEVNLPEIGMTIISNFILNVIRFQRWKSDFRRRSQCRDP